MNLKEEKLMAETCGKNLVDELIYEHIKIMEENIRLSFENKQLRINVQLLYSKLECLKRDFGAISQIKAQTLVFRNYKIKN